MQQQKYFYSVYFLVFTTKDTKMHKSLYFYPTKLIPLPALEQMNRDVTICEWAN